MNHNPVKKAATMAFMVKWHRWIGFAVAIIVLLLSITGIALNHTDGLKLGSRAMPAWATSLFYGNEVQQLPAFTVAGHEFMQCPAGQLNVNGQMLMNCGQLSGVLQNEDYLVAVCNLQLALFSPDAELIESFYLSGELASVASLQEKSSALLITGVDEKPAILDLVTLESKPVTDAANLPATVKVVAVDSVGENSNTLTWERLLQDLHAGRAVGGWGVWLVDLTAIGLIWLVISGYLGWRARQKLMKMS